MELHPTRLPPDGARVFRHPRVSNWVAALVAWSPLAGAALVLPAAMSGASFWAWVVGAPFVLVLGLSVWIVALTLTEVALASTGPANWLAAMEGSALWLNLRSYRNAHFDDAESTVARIDWSEVKRAGLVTETLDRPTADGPVRERSRWVELELACGTDALRAAVEAERTRPAPERVGMLGIRSRVRHQHQIVVVSGPHAVRVQGLRALRAELLARVPALPERELHLNSRLDGMELEQRVRALLERGHRFEALRVVRDERALSLAEAKAWLDELERAA